MKSWKRMLMLVLAFAMISMTLAGCGGEKGVTEDGRKILKAWSSAVHSKDVVGGYIEKMNDTVFKDQGFYIEYETYGNDYGKTLDMAIANETGPNLFSGSVTTYAKKGQISALEDIPGGQDLLDMYPEEAAASDKIRVQGDDTAKTYSLFISYVTYGMVYNRDLFKEAGIVDENGEAALPKTWEEVRVAAKKITKPEDNQYGIVMPFKWSAYANNELVGPWEASASNRADGGFRQTFKYTVEDNEKHMLEWWLSIRDDGSYYPGPEGLDNDPARANFATGKIGMKPTASWDIANFNGQFDCNAFDWAIMPYPVYDENANIKTQSLSTNSFLSIAAYNTDEEKEMCVKALMSLCSKEMQQLLYEKGMYIPISSAALNDAVIDENDPSYLKGWKEIAGISAFSQKSPISFSLTVPGDSKQATYLKVWAGQMSIEDALNDYRDRSQSALDDAVAHGEIILDDYRDGWQSIYLTDEQKAIRAAYWD